MQLPIGVQQILSSLFSAGFDGYVVGGAVRDYLLKQPIKDFDLVTNALPVDLEKLFPVNNEGLPTFESFAGNQFGVSRVRIAEGDIEVATFRQDGIYLDGKPVQIEFATVKEDVLRRDFTINALLWDERTKSVVDHVGGIEDLNNQVLRAVGVPSLRFREDPIRILRAIRIALKLGFSIEKETWSAICVQADFVGGMPFERTSQEFNKILKTDPIQGFKMLVESKVLFAMFQPIHKNALWVKEVKFKTDYLLYWLLILENTIFKGKMEEVIWKRLTNEERREITEIFKLVKLLDEKPESENYRRVAHHDLYLKVRDYLTLTRRISEKVLGFYKDEISKIPLLEEAFLSGGDLVDLGFTPGKQVGEVLKKLQNAIYKKEVITRRDAENFVKTFLN